MELHDLLGRFDLPDLINGLFELGGGIFLMLNIRLIRQHRRLQGVHWWPTLHFTAWGVWNLFYYSHLDQVLSFLGGVLIVIVNTVWLAHIALYAWQDGYRPRWMKCRQNATASVVEVCDEA